MNDHWVELDPTACIRGDDRLAEMIAVDEVERGAGPTARRDRQWRA